MKICHSRSVIALSVLSVAGAASTAQAVDLFAADGALSMPGNLYRVDTSSGLLTTVGALVDSEGGEYSINGMAWDASSNTLFGSTSSMSPTLPNGLVQIDRGTGQVTQIGSLNLTPTNFSAGLDYTDGTLFGWAEGSLSSLITIDTLSGVGNVVGSNAQGINTTGSGLATNAMGTTFSTPDGSTGNLWQVNRGTGQLFGPTPLSGGMDNGRIGALEFLGDTLFGVELVGDGVSGITSNRLISIDPVSGAITGIGQFRDADTEAFIRNVDAIAIPSPGAASMLGLAGVAALRRRR
jgi:hypothetical protein